MSLSPSRPGGSGAEARKGIAFFLVGMWFLPVGVISCQSPQTDVTRRTALVGDTIESVTQVLGQAPVTITTSANPNGSINGASFNIGLFEEDAVEQCQPRHPPPPLSYNPQCAIRDDSYCGFFRCLVMGDIALFPYPSFSPHTNFPTLNTSFEDISVVETVINVGQSTTAHWNWTYESWHSDLISAFNVDVVTEDGEITHIIGPIAGPPETYASNYAPLANGPNSTDLEMSQFWPGQRVKLRFILRNTFFPGIANILYPGYPAQGLDASGLTDVAMAKVIVDNFRVDDTCSVDSVEFQEIDSQLDPNPSFLGGGERIFPDKQGPNDGTDRSAVRVVAHMNQPNCPVTFRALDVDDPSSDGIIDTNGPEGEDNDVKGDCGSFVNGQNCVVSPNPQPSLDVAVTFNVTKLPGANFVIVAGTDGKKVAGVTTRGLVIADSDSNGLPTSSLKLTPMLTVWRRLHIERDSMGAVTGNHVVGTILRVVLSPQCIELTGSVGLIVDSLLDYRRFEPGRVLVNGQSIGVDTNLINTICVSGPVSAFSNLEGLPFTLYDDDDFNANDGSALHGDEGEVLRIPRISITNDSDDPLLNVLAPAYIRPTYDIGSGTGEGPFVLNVENYNAIQDLFTHFDNVASTNDPEFWTIYLLGGYQGKVTKSLDPDFGDGTLGLSIQGGQGSIIFLETANDAGARVTFVDEAISVAHEIGHVLCADHGDRLIMGMDDGVPETDTFAAESIATIRKALRWRGGCNARK